MCVFQFVVSDVYMPSCLHLKLEEQRRNSESKLSSLKIFPEVGHITSLPWLDLYYRECPLVTQEFGKCTLLGESNHLSSYHSDVLLLRKEREIVKG